MTIENIQPGNFGADTQRYIRAIAMRFVRNDSDADDIAQDAMIAAHRYAASFRGDCKYSTWLYRVTCRAALMHLRRHRRQRQEMQLQDDSPVDARVRGPVLICPSLNPARQAECDELLQNAVAAANRLGPKYRRVFELRYLGGCTETEIAKQLALPLATVKTRAFRARRAAIADHLAA
jgi:RNA polymerase sigma-70 factor, ECF subfamily